MNGVYIFFCFLTIFCAFIDCVVQWPECDLVAVAQRPCPVAGGDGRIGRVGSSCREWVDWAGQADTWWDRRWCVQRAGDWMDEGAGAFAVGGVRAGKTVLETELCWVGGDEDGHANGEGGVGVAFQQVTCTAVADLKKKTGIWLVLTFHWGLFWLLNIWFYLEFGQDR